MKFTDAFHALGYRVAVPRQDWSAEREDGVCITLWTKELDWESMSVDTRLHAGPNDLWRTKPGNRKGIAHLTRALDAFSGRVDVVTVHGEPGEGFGDASPWRPEERRGHTWRILAVEPERGHFQAQAKPDGT